MRSYGRQSHAGNCITSMSGAKNANARASVAMRGPSRQITVRLTAGGTDPAATERARSASTKPSAPSATLPRTSGRPGTGRYACDLSESVIVRSLVFSPGHPARIGVESASFASTGVS